MTENDRQKKLNEVKSRIKDGSILGDVNISYCNLNYFPEFLKGITITGHFIWSANHIKSFENIPRFIGNIDWENDVPSWLAGNVNARNEYLLAIKNQLEKYKNMNNTKQYIIQKIKHIVTQQIVEANSESEAMDIADSNEHLYVVIPTNNPEVSYKIFAESN